MIEDYDPDPYKKLGDALGIGRNDAKAPMLAFLYGVGHEKWAAMLGTGEDEAKTHLEALKRKYATFIEWQEQVITEDPMRSYGGWELHRGTAIPLTRKNFHIQAACAEIVRHSAVALDDGGIEIVALHHDAIWVESAAEEIEAIAQRVEDTIQANAVAIMGAPLRTDREIVQYPGRYSSSPSDTERFNDFLALLEEIEKNPKPDDPGKRGAALHPSLRVPKKGGSR